jgi:hypothetical protein
MHRAEGKRKQSQSLRRQALSGDAGDPGASGEGKRSKLTNSLRRLQDLSNDAAPRDVEAEEDDGPQVLTRKIFRRRERRNLVSYVAPEEQPDQVDPVFNASPHLAAPRCSATLAGGCVGLVCGVCA